MSTVSASDGVAQEAAGAGPVPGPQGTAAQADGSRVRPQRHASIERFVAGPAPPPSVAAEAARAAAAMSDWTGGGSLPYRLVRIEEALPFEDVEGCWKGRRDEWRDEVVGAAGSAVDLAGLLAELLCSLTAAAVSYLWRSRGEYDKLYGELYDLASGRRSDPVAATLRRLVAAVETAALPPADARERQLKVVQLPPAEAAEGAAVQVFFSDEERWYRGTITAVNENKTFTVLFEDGDEDTSVPLCDLYQELPEDGKPLELGLGDPGPDLAEGDRATALHLRRAWCAARVAAVRDGLFEGTTELLIKYEGWAAKWDEWVQRDSGRLRPYRPDELALSALPDEVLLLILSQLACSLSLRRASAVCRSWRARLRRGERDADQLFENTWLRLPVVDPLDGRVCLGVAGALSRAPAGERLRLSAGTKLRPHDSQLVCARAVHLVADAGAALCDGTLHLHGGEGAGGLVEGLAISHFRDEAVVVHAGAWTLRGCSIASSRKSRAVTAVTVRPGATLRLESCVVRNALSAAMLHDGAELRAAECVFDNTRTGVISRGGHLELERCRIEAPCDVVLKLNPRTTGHATANQVACSLFGGWQRPVGFRRHSNVGLPAAEEAAEAEEGAEAEMAAADPVVVAEPCDRRCAIALAHPPGCAAPGRNPLQGRPKYVWSVEEDLALLAGVRRYGTQFPLIAAGMPPLANGAQRTPDAVRNRHHRLQNQDRVLQNASELRKASEREAVDALLAGQSSPSPPPGAAADGSLVLYDPKHVALSEARPTTCIRGADHGRAYWSPEEDALIKQAHDLHGSQWRCIAAQLPGRSDSSVRNRWARLKEGAKPALSPPAASHRHTRELRAEPVEPADGSAPTRTVFLPPDLSALAGRIAQAAAQADASSQPPVMATLAEI